MSWKEPSSKLWLVDVSGKESSEHHTTYALARCPKGFTTSLDGNRDSMIHLPEISMSSFYQSIRADHHSHVTREDTCAKDRSLTDHKPAQHS